MDNLLVTIVSPDGEIFSGEAKSILVTADTGEIQIMRSHADLLAPLATGRAKLTLTDGSEKRASVSGGFILVSGGEAKVVATTFEFADNIDLERARRARDKAEEKLKNAKSANEISLAKAKLARALTRIAVKSEG